MKTMKRLLSLMLCLVLLAAVMPSAVADPALRAYCYNFQVTDDGLQPTGISFSMGAQYGKEPYTMTYTVGALSGTASAGKVTLPMTLAPGDHNFTITVKAKDANNTESTASLTASVHVNADGSYTRTLGPYVAPETVKVTKINLDKSAVTVRVGSTEQLTATVEPAGAANKNVTYTSSDSTIASVSAGGLITGVKAGTCTITATAADGSGVTATCAVIVAQSVTGLTLSPSSISLAPSGSATLTPVITPSDATNKNVTYTSSNTSIAVVSNTGLVIGQNEGVAVITAVSVDNPAVIATCTVTVGTPVTGISLSQNSAGLETGKTLTLIATVTPDSATNKTVNWTTSDKTIATVSNGVVSTWKAGTCTITATAADGSGHSASCTITVTGAEVTPPADVTPGPTGGGGGSVTPPPLTPPEGQTGWVNTAPQGGGLNLRKNPSTNATRITVIPENASLTVVTYGGTWCYVWYNGYYGYVMTKFVKLGSAPTPTDTTPSGPTPSPAPETPEGTTAFVYTKPQGGKLNMRKSASANASIITRIPEDASFTVITYGTQWCYAWYNGHYGYVMSKFVRLAGETAMPSGPDTPTPTGGGGGSVTPPPAPTGNQAVVTTPSGKLNMRKAPDLKAARITLIPPGKIVDVITYGTDWCYISYNGMVGYVMTKFLVMGSGVPTTTPTPTVPVPTGSEKYAQVCTEQGGLNLREGAGLGYARVLVIPENAYMQVLTYGKNWSYVRYNGHVGYVMTKFIKMI